MKPTEAAALLTIAAAYDNRKPDADQAKAWSMVLDGVNFQDARDAVVAHYRTSREWLMPVNIIQGVKAIRHQRILEFGATPTPPAELVSDPPAYSAWIADAMKRIADGELTRADFEAPALEERPMPAFTAGRSVRDGLRDDPVNARAAAHQALGDSKAEKVPTPEPPAPAPHKDAERVRAAMSETSDA